MVTKENPSPARVLSQRTPLSSSKVTQAMKVVWSIKLKAVWSLMSMIWQAKITQRWCWQYLMEMTCPNKNYTSFIKAVKDNNPGSWLCWVKKMEEVCRITTSTRCGTIATNVDKLQLQLKAFTNNLRQGKQWCKVHIIIEIQKSYLW